MTDKTLAFCILKYFPFGGQQKDFLRIATACKALGFGIRVYTLSWEGDIPEGFDVRFVPVRARRNHIRVRKFSEWVEAELKREPVDGVVGFSKLPGLDVYYAADGCFEDKARNQRGALYRTGGRYRQYSAYEQAVFAPSSKTEVMLISPMQEQLFKKYYQTPDERLHLLPPNMIEDRALPENPSEVRSAFREENHFSDTDLLIVQIGSGFIKKGVDRSIRAIASLPAELRKRIKFWVIGRDRAGRFERLAAKLGVEEQVVFTGGRDDVPNILLGADLMLHPAYDEAGGLVLLEALASGLPVLCTEICGFAHHVEAADCGQLIREPFDPSSLDRQLLSLLSEADLPSLGKNGIEYAEATDFCRMPQAAAEIIERTVGAKA